MPATFVGCVKRTGSKYWNEWLTFPVRATDVKDVETTLSPLRIGAASLTMHPRSGAKIECKHILHPLIAIAASSNWTDNLVSNTPGRLKRRSHGRFSRLCTDLEIMVDDLLAWELRSPAWAFAFTQPIWLVTVAAPASRDASNRMTNCWRKSI